METILEESKDRKLIKIENDITTLLILKNKGKVKTIELINVRKTRFVVARKFNHATLEQKFTNVKEITQKVLELLGNVKSTKDFEELFTFIWNAM